MKILFIFILFLISNNLFAEINVNKCDLIEQKSKKISCLTKLKAKALKEGTKEKIKIIDQKFNKIWHQRDMINVKLI